MLLRAGVVARRGKYFSPVRLNSVLPSPVLLLIIFLMKIYDPWTGQTNEPSSKTHLRLLNSAVTPSSERQSNDEAELRLLIKSLERNAKGKKFNGEELPPAA